MQRNVQKNKLIFQVWAQDFPHKELKAKTEQCRVR
jgi:hypothetical protein